MRQGRTFAAMPRSTCQMSPGFTASILSLLFVHVFKHRIGGFVEKERLVLLFKFTQPLADGSTLIRRQFGQFLHDFRGAHGTNLPPLANTGKSSGSRPVKTTPEISTSSPTFSARILSSVKGKLSLIILPSPQYSHFPILLSTSSVTP